MNTRPTAATFSDETIFVRLIPLDSDYYRVNVSPTSLGAPMTPRGGSQARGQFSTYPPFALSSQKYFQGADRRLTESIRAETIQEISAAASGIASKWCREPKTSGYLLRSPNPPTTATNRPEESLSEMVGSIRRDPRLRFGERLAKRLERLIEISREEQPEQPPPALASVKALIGFLSENPELRYPTTVLTPDGNVRVEWRRAREEHFALEFLGDVDVKFVVFATDPKRPYKVARVSGWASLDSVMTLVAPYGVRDWSAEQDKERPGV